jgi:nucleoside 2-deoxyribosyltransferase
MKVYLAGPITGLSWEEATAWRNQMIAEMKPLGIQCYSPLRAKVYLSHLNSIPNATATQPLSTARGIYTRDKWDATRCDVLFVNFLGAQKVSTGTVLEIAWADAKDIPIILVMEEDNIHRHAMIMECAGYVVPTLDDGMHILKSLFIQE